MNSHNIPESEITKGAKIELEHEKTFKKYLGDNCDIAAICKDIAIDHLEINPNAYKESFVGDVIAMNVPLFIRTLELAREDIKSDADLHRFVEKVIIASKNGKVLTMDDYDGFLENRIKENSFAKGGKVNFDVEEDEDRITISLNGIGEVILVQTFPEYEFIEDIDEDTLEELSVSEGDIIGKIEHLEVNDNFKGKGYAKLLMNKAIEIAEQYGWMPLYLNASPMGSKKYGLGIEDLTGFYESLGFKVFLNQGGNNLMMLNKKENSFAKGGSVMLAPNGESSNLTPKQWKLVRTPEFKAWFGDWENDPANASKVVDENGEPLICYHRSKKTFNLFDDEKQLNGWLGKGFYFSESKLEFKDYGNKLLSVFINIKNPFKVKGNSPADFLYELKNTFNADDFNTTEILKNNSYDGVIYKHWDYEGRMFSCFNSNQIKLADGTNTTFDGNNPDIRFEEGGEVENLKSMPYKELMLLIKDSYKELGAEIGVKGHTKDGEPIIGYLPYQTEYMYESDSTGRKIRFFIDLGNDKYIHPSEVNENFNVSEQKRIEEKADYFVRLSNETYDKLISDLVKNNELENVIETLKKALNNFNIENSYDSADIFKSFGNSILESKKTPFEGAEKIRIKFNTYYSRVNDLNLKSNLNDLDLERFKSQYLSENILKEGGSVEYPLESKNLWYGDSDYENRGGKMIMMSPKEYIQSVRPLDIDEASRDNIDDLKQHILSGRKLDPLTIQKDGKEDGRHRAYAALELGIKEVPVIIFKDGGKIQLNSNKGKVNLNLEKNWKEDTELVLVSELLKFREFDRLVTPKYNYEDSENNINNLEKLLLENGVEEPLIIEYSQEDKAVLLIEGNHRLNVADKLGFDYLPARVVLRRRPFQQQQKMKSLKVKGFKPDEYGYVPSNLKPSQVGIKGTIKAFEEGGIIEGQLHSECNENTGCGEKFDVGNSGHIIEAERDEAVIVSSAFKDDNKYEIKGTLSQIASALNVIGEGKNFDSGAEIKFEDGKVFEVSEIKQEAKNTDVETIDPNSIIINRRSMYDKNIYLAKGTPKEIASQINNINGNGVKIIDGGSIHKIQ